MEQGETIKGFLTIRMESGVRNSRMVIADIPGKSENFILINGHYDSWYEGITDNATSDAIMLELARVFWKHREKLERSVRIAVSYTHLPYMGNQVFTVYRNHIHYLCIGSRRTFRCGCRLLWWKGR